MIRILLTLLIGYPLYGALSVTKIGTTNTSIAIRVSGATGGDCTIELSESASYTPPAADADSTKYAGSNTCAGRSDTVTSGSDLLVKLGHKVSDRALYTDTTYYLRVTSGSDTVALTLKTDTIGVGQSFPWPAPVDRTHRSNRGFGGTVAKIFNKESSPDPVTGARMWSLANHIKNLPVEHSFVHWADGTGWTNPSHVIDTATAGAQTNNTNPLTLYFGTESDPGNGLYKSTSWDDLGIVVYACGDSLTDSNRAFTLTLSNNFSGGTMGTPVTVSGSAVPQCASPSTPLPHVASTSTITDNPWPNNFPSPPFSGWGTGAFFGMDDRPTSVSVSSVSSVLTAPSVDLLHHFSPALEVGNRIAFAGCTDGSGLCTVSALGNAKSATVSDSIANASGTAQVLRAGVRIAKTNATGTLWVSVKYTFAESLLENTYGGALATVCNTNSGTVTTGDGHVGHQCMWTAGTAAPSIYFVSDDGTVRLMWNGAKPKEGPYPYNQYFTDLGWASEDIPERLNLMGNVVPDPNDPAGWYVQGNHSDGSPQALYHIHYSGTYAEVSTDYTIDADGLGFCCTPMTAPSDGFDWTVVGPASSTYSFQTQIEANFAYYPSAIAGFNFSLIGVSGTTAYFDNKMGRGQDYPGWVAIADVSSAPMTVTNVFSTYEGHGVNGKTHYGSDHNTGAHAFPPNTVVLSTDPLPHGIADEAYYRGPFALPILAIDRGTVGSPSWSTDTSLHWPIPTDGTYLTTCPTNDRGWTGERCVHIKTTPGGQCDSQPHHLELAATPCPSNTTGITFPATVWDSGSGISGLTGWDANTSSFAQPFTIRKGDTFADNVRSGNTCGGAPGDCENFTVITDPVTEGDGSTTVWVARDAGFDYCCLMCAIPHDSTPQNDHTTGWIGSMLPNEGVGCSASNYIVQGQTEGAQTVVEVPRTLSGHTDLVEGVTAGSYAFVQAIGSNQASTLAGVFDPSTQKSFAAPTWHGLTTNIGAGVQSYANTPGQVPWMLDVNAVLGNSGGSAEGAAGSFDTAIITTTSCADVYRISALGTPDYKNVPLRGVAGAYPLQEVSSPTVDLCASGNDFSLAYAYANGEAMHGTVTGGGASVAGEIYVKVPKAQYDLFGSSSCIATQHWANTPCVLGADGVIGGGFYRQNDWTANNAAGTHTHWVTSGQEVPMAQYGYTGFVPIGTGAAWASWSMVDGWGMAPWLVKLPTFVNDGGTTNRTDYISVPVTASTVAGATKARVRFGRNPSFYCVGSDAIAANGSLDWSGRKEACVTDSSGAPFKFASESETRQACASGCVINVPVVAQTVNYAQVEYMDNAGSIVQTDPVQVLMAGAPVLGPCFDLVYTPTSASAIAGGDTGTFDASVTDGSCDRSITVASGAASCTANCSGSGSVSGIAWSMPANVGPARNSTLTGGGVNFTISQASGCTFSISPTSHTYGAAGAGQSVTITTASGCTWTASYPDAWLSGTTSGIGSGSITVTAAANSGPLRTSTATIAGQSYAATQDASTGSGVPVIGGGVGARVVR